MKTILLIIALAFSLNLFSQTYPVGHKQITFTDPARSNRSIATDIYYPATTAGDDVPWAAGQFPLIVFGHGFIMSDPALYAYLYDSLVPQGYIFAFPTTEAGFIFPPPVHLDFANDLSFLNDFIKNENTVTTSFFYNHVGNTSAIGGHSMGGKGSVMACKNNTNVTTMFNMGAALSDPPTGTANNALGDYAPYVSVPALIISGAKDAVAAPADNQIPLYDTIASTCKTFISITEGWHCYFASEAGYGIPACETLESASGSMTRAHQNDIVISYLKPYFAYTLKGDAAAGISFISKLTTGSEITYRRDCNTSGICFEDISNMISVYPNPVNDIINIDLTAISNKTGNIIISDITGRVLLVSSISSNSINRISVKSLPSGIYFAKIKTSDSEIVKKFVK